MSMMDAAKRAVSNLNLSDDPSVYTRVNPAWCETIVRTVLTAVRVPDERVEKIGDGVIQDVPGWSAFAFTEMVDAILSEPQS